MPTYTYQVGAADEGRRLDTYLRDVDEPSETRSQVKKRIDRGEVSVNGETAPKAGVRLEEGDAIRWEYEPPTEPDLEPQDLPLEFLYEDEEVAVNGETASKGGVRIEEGDEVRWDYEPPTEPDLEAQDLPLEFLYEDDDLADRLESLRQSAGIPGLSVATVRNGEVDRVVNLGVRNVETNAAVDDATVVHG